MPSLLSGHRGLCRLPQDDRGGEAAETQQQRGGGAKLGTAEEEVPLQPDDHSELAEGGAEGDAGAQRGEQGPLRHHPVHQGRRDQGCCYSRIKDQVL